MTSFSRLCYSRNPRRAVVAVLALVWVGLACSCHRNEVGSAEIRDAAQTGDLARIRALLKSHPDLVFNKDDKGNTPLHWAAVRGHKDVAELLRPHNADVNAGKAHGAPPFPWAASADNTEELYFLLANISPPTAIPPNT